MALHA
jgi:hypothetical protein